MSTAAGELAVDVTRVVYDALDHYLDQLIVDAREGSDRAAWDMADVEDLLHRIDPVTWTTRDGVPIVIGEVTS